jgi:hypothetical protein
MNFNLDDTIESLRASGLFVVVIDERTQFPEPTEAAEVQA